jgi:branched-chain amino acid transport system permease protein
MLTKKNFGWLALMLVVYLVVKGLVLTGILNPYYQITFMIIVINIILALGLNLIIGFTGQFSLGHAGFMSIGAYCTGIVLVNVPGLQGFALGAVIGLTLCFVVSMLIALPTLRLKGDYLAIATLGFAEIIRIIVINLKITNGASGLSNIPKVINVDLAMFLLLISILVVVNFIYSAAGRACVSIREDEIASDAMGINTTKYKTMAFVIGTMLAALAGSMYAGYFYVIYPQTFGFIRSIDVLIIVVFGGMGSLTGSVFAAILLGLINLFLQNFSDLRMIVYALLLIAIMVFRPGGLMGRKEFTMQKLFDKFGGNKV